NLYVIYLVKQTKWMPLMIMAASIVSIGLNFILIPRVGIVGAAISNISAYFVLAAIVTVWANKALSYNLDYKYLGKVLAATAVMGLSLSFMNIDGILDIAVAVILATAIIWTMLLVLKSFSRHEEALIKKTFGSFIPWLR
ncbi:MAG: polysaccharide biosynthesis C-terminal domain-containing protein, partial [Dehalococcoidales bacterium]|nr:polysaccharide biosynthesis C-terminal domain-containing protein [Dehalococcoidales bacterium]